MNKTTFAILGCGSRGIGTYACASRVLGDRMKIVALADIDPSRLAKAAEDYDVPKERCFASGEAMLTQPRLADALIIATMDQSHVAFAIKAMTKGYAVLLEKPISPLLSECRQIEKANEKYPVPVVVCHVLRYTNFYRHLKALLDEGAIGEIKGIQAIENVSYWHMAHSFVRGNWRNSKTTSPMILQKCCHDMDLFVWLTGKKAIRVSSFGALSFFKKENAPKEAKNRCVDCSVASCPFDARKIYLENEITGFCKGNHDWPVNVLCLDPSEESIENALKEGPYGRCVFSCDNNVVDHQVVNIEMENSLFVNFTMTAFTKECHRFIKVMGSKGDIFGDAEKSVLHVEPFEGKSHLVDTTVGQIDFSGHGGGDVMMLRDFISLIESGAMPKGLTRLTDSLESHYLCFAAEKSRLENGRPVLLDKMRGVR